MTTSTTTQAPQKRSFGDRVMGIVGDPQILRLIIILILLLIGAIPTRARFGYAPMGIVGTILVIVLILMLLGRI